MIEQHPADTAKPGDAFVDESGVTWMKVDASDGYPPWLTPRRVNGTRWHAAREAREHTFTALVTEVELTEQLDVLPIPDASDPAHVRFAAVVCDAAGVHTAVTKNAVTSVGAWLRALADRLEVYAADRQQAECIAAEVYGGGQVTIGDISRAAFAGIRAGRDAERGALPPKDKDKDKGERNEGERNEGERNDGERNDG